MPSPAALWLVLDHPVLQHLLEAQCRRRRAPIFEAHVTVLGAIAIDDLVSAVASTIQVASLTREIVLPTRGLGESAEWRKTAFVRCSATPELTRMRRRARTAFKSGRGPSGGPHLSLAYGPLDPGSRRRILAEWPGLRSLRFSSLALVVPGERGWPAVDDWQIVARAALPKEGRHAPPSQRE